MVGGVDHAVAGDGVLEELLGLTDLLGLGEVHRVAEAVEEPVGRLGDALPRHLLRHQLGVLLGDHEGRDVAPVHEVELPGQQGHVHSVPLSDEPRPVSPVHTHLLERLPQGRAWEGLDTGDEPDLVENSQHSLTQLVTDILLHRRRGQQSVVDGQEEGEERVPGLLLHDLGLLGQLLDPPEDPVADHGLSVDGLLGCNEKNVEIVGL